MTFTLYPAIDLRQGKVVRLQQGRLADQTVYSDDPVKVALDFAAQGARWLHIVNLDGAFGEDTRNLEMVRAIRAACGVPVQFGGGLRTLADIDQALVRGVDRVILGTVALRDPELVRQAARELGERLVVGIDARDGHVAVEGWVETSKMTAADLAARMFDAGVSRFVYTDITRDGMLVGPDLEGAATLAQTGAKVIASGGVGSLDHVQAAGVIGRGVDGLIVGKALYEARFTVREALQAVKGKQK
jgi:phosphoribosylformimino-5-aminoimidazole carboxamide ribotide isomerase